MYKHFHSQFMAVLAPILYVICSTAVQAKLPDPISLWRFDEGSGKTAVDTGTGGYDGTLVGDVMFVQDEERGSVLEFGTNESFVDTNAWIAEMGNADFSMAAWIQTSQDGAAIVGKSNGDRDWSFHEKQFYLSAGTEQGAPVAGGVHFYGNQAGEIWGATPVDTSTWHHVCVTWDNDTDEQHIYVDGELDDLRPVWVYYGGRGDIVDDIVRIGFDCSGDATSDFSGRMDDVAIFNVTLTPDQVVELMHLPQPRTASNPLPYDGATDLLRQGIVLNWKSGPSANTHNVYFGQTFEDVNDASVDNPLDVLAREEQTQNTYDPGLLDYGQTYYWRVDEVNGTPDKTVFRGGVWSLTVEPYAIMIPVDVNNVTASSFTDTNPPGMTVNGSGLTGDMHSDDSDDMWLSATTDLSPWLMVEFDQPQKLDHILIWNSNDKSEGFIGWGIKDVNIETSVDGAAWTSLGESSQISRAPGLPTYNEPEVVDLGLVLAKYVRLNILSNWGGFFKQYGVSEVQFYGLPTFARDPDPKSGSMDSLPDTMLTWRAGREASEHIVYVGTNPDDVAAGTTSSFTTSTQDLDTGTLDLQLSQTYYWRVDEVNDARTPSVWAGPVWSFTTVSSLVVDNFESYGNRSPNRPFQTWLDGFGYSADEFFPVAYGGNGTGSGVGHDIWSPGSPYFEGKVMEQGIALEGSNQSMPLYYTNAGGVPSQTDRIWAAAQDWTVGGPDTLVVHFFGGEDNTGGPLFIKINGHKVTYPDSAHLSMAEWHAWEIDLTALGINLRAVTSLSLGVEGIGSGKILIDDLRLQRSGM